MIGRLILMHLPDPAAALRRLSSFVRPGGVIAFSENDIAAARSVPDMPLFAQVIPGIVRAFEGMGLSARGSAPRCTRSSPTPAWARRS